MNKNSNEIAIQTITVQVKSNNKTRENTENVCDFNMPNKKKNMKIRKIMKIRTKKKLSSHILFLLSLLLVLIFPFMLPPLLSLRLFLRKLVW